MSSDLARHDPRQPAPAQQAARPNPLRQLPEEWREPVAFFYAVFSDILKGTTGLVARFRLWAKDDGLTIEEARGIMRRLMRPDKAAAIQFPGQLMAAIAEGVEAAVKHRRDAARRAEQTAASLAPPAGDPDAVRRAIRERVGGIGDAAG